MEIHHIPVLLNETIDLLNLKEDSIVIDATLGEGGHSVEILKRIPKGFLIGIDMDYETIERAKQRLLQVSDNFVIVPGNFKEIKSLILPFAKNVTHILADLGVSSLQLEDESRGFSFMKEGPLDMRMCRPCTRYTAYDIVNNFEESEIRDIILYYGEDPLASKIARRIIEERKKHPIETTTQLAEIIKGVYPKGYYRIHPATRTFQALRIFINRELDNLKEFLESAPTLLLPKGRIAIITYHSLEDRLVKQSFRNNPTLKLVNKHVIKPKEEEIENNRRARSAKLRVAEKVV
ncbi:MAG: 16S rRNA (cytosine(1402)-N(4))-methyltransferase RsmH [Caldisericum sp.]|uniref:Ribosomal RNA small subunit methyltransferase H n=1 Tax=Caldisericum exile TaxID=693075 RepID=A0A2J6X5W7_9BACT|nr:MAG: 16S rRNA (cytosine(1402)-N(4))-methyltransferase [Caldisericum exile]